MSPQMVSAIAILLSEAASAGVSIAAVLEEARATGKVSDEQWDEIIDRVQRANEAWEQAPE